MLTEVVPSQIHEICPSCHPQKLIKTTCTFIEKEDDVADEYLYQCDKCKARIWVDKQWAVSNKVTTVNKKSFDSVTSTVKAQSTLSTINV